MKTQALRQTYDLLADVGGTNTRLALAQDGHLLAHTMQRLKNQDFPSFDAVLGAYLAHHPQLNVDTSAVAIAGPVEDGAGTMTNLNWHITPNCLTKATQSNSSFIINDLQAQGYAIDRLDHGQITPISPGKPAMKGATRLVVGLGTGFNAVPVFCQANTLFVPPSETGHADLSVRGEEECALAAYLSEPGAGAAVESLLSGNGLARAYAYFAGYPQNNPPPEPGWVIKAAQSGADAHASTALEYFVRVLARNVGDLALIHLPFGGIFLVGGVARAITPFLGTGNFEQEFNNKGRFKPFMENFKISTVNNDFAALNGCIQAIEQTRI